MRKLVLTGAAAALLVGLWWALGRDGDPAAAGASSPGTVQVATSGARADRRGAASGAERARAAGAAAPAGQSGDDGRPSGTPPLDVPATAKDGFVEVEVQAGGARLAGAEVMLYLRGATSRAVGHADWRLAGAAKTGANGVARLPARAGSYLASAHAGTLAPARKQFTRAQGEPVTRVALALEPGATLQGRTVAKGSREAVPLATVTLTPALDSAQPGPRRGPRMRRPDAPVEEQASATSDRNGVFRVAELQPGAYLVEAQATGHAKAVAARVQVPRPDELVLELSASGFLEGTVVGADGKPAAGALVAASSTGRGGALLTAVATDQGAFSLEAEPRTYKLSAQRGSEAAALDKPVPVAAGETVRGLTLQLGPGSAIEGQVVTSLAGAPVAGATVSLTPYRGEGQAGAAVSDGAGKFVVEGLAPGSYDVLTTADGFTPDQRRGVTVLQGQRFPLRIELQGTGSVEGLVRAASGAPVAGAVVSGGQFGRGFGPGMMPLTTATPPEARTGPDGRYRLDGLAPGRSRLGAHRDGSDLGDSQTADVPEGGVARADFTLRDEGVLTGRVASKTGGPLRAPATVRAVPTGGAMMILGPGGMASTETDAAGSYKLVLPAATYAVVATSTSTPGMGFPRSRNMATVEAGQTAIKDVSIDDDPSDTGLSGQVLEPSGEPSVGAMVRISSSSAGARFVSMMPTDDQGKFTVAGTRASLPASLDVYAINGGRTGRVSVGSEQTQAIVQLQPAARLRGHVSGAAAVQGFRVTVAQLNPNGMPMRMPAQDLEFSGDRFDVSDVPPDQVLVSVKTRDGRAGDAQTTLAPGQAGDVEVALQDTVTVTGRVVGADGAPVKGAMITADSDPPRLGAETGADGRFSLPSLKAGDHTVAVYSAPATFKRQPFTVGNGAPLDLGDIKLDPPRADPGTIGASLRPDGDGVAVAFVLPAGPADVAGMRTGDLLVAIDGVPVRSLDDARARASGTPGSPVAVTIRRSGNASTLQIVRAQ